MQIFIIGIEFQSAAQQLWDFSNESRQFPRFCITKSWKLFLHQIEWSIFFSQSECSNWLFKIFSQTASLNFRRVIFLKRSAKEPEMTFSCFWMSSHFCSASILSRSSSSSDFLSVVIVLSPSRTLSFFLASSTSLAFLKRSKYFLSNCLASGVSQFRLGFG